MRNRPAKAFVTHLKAVTWITLVSGKAYQEAGFSLDSSDATELDVRGREQRPTGDDAPFTDEWHRPTNVTQMHCKLELGKLIIDYTFLSPLYHI